MTSLGPRPFTPRPAQGAPKRRVIDKLKDALTIAGWVIAGVIVLMVFLRHLGFTVGVNITAIGMFYLTTAIVFVKASRYAEDAVVIGGAVVCFMGLFAFCPMSLMWEWATMVLLLLLVITIEMARFIKKAVQTAEKVGDELIGAVTRVVSKDVIRQDDTPHVIHRTKVPQGPREWILSALMGLATFLAANVFRHVVHAWWPTNVMFAATAAIGLGVLGMMVVAFSRANNANEDLLAGASIAVGWTGLFVAWPHPVWHIIVLLVIMSILAGATVGPIISRKVMRYSDKLHKHGAVVPLDGKPARV